jgi:two-component system, OmpR family, sensor histidine kinase KdpD
VELRASKKQLRYNTRVRRQLPLRVIQLVVSLGIVLGITVFYLRVFPVNQTTVALTFLLAILAVSVLWGFAVAACMSVAAMLAFNYFFLPPIGTFTIADPQNWMALFAFLAASLITSRLATRVRQERDAAEQRRREVERLYAFSQRMLVSGNVIQLLNAIPNHIVETFEVGAAALYLDNKQKFYRSGAGAHFDDEELKLAMARGDMLRDANRSLSFIPVRMGTRAIGSLGISGRLLSPETLEALSSMIAIAFERARAVEDLGKAEAAREGEQLKSALLDSVTHDFRTPLTSIKVSVTSLLSNPSVRDGRPHELLTIIDEECDRLNQLVGDAAEMARLDAGEFELHLEPVPIGDVVSAAVSQSKNLLGSRPVNVKIDRGLPPVNVDFDRIKDVLARLIENADAYSPKDRPITITAEVSGNTLVTSVADQGPGIEEMELGLIFDKFYRGKDQRYLVHGTGMGLPIAKAIAAAHGGTVNVVSQRNHGSVFSVVLPLTPVRGAAR